MRGLRDRPPQPEHANGKGTLVMEPDIKLSVDRYWANGTSIAKTIEWVQRKHKTKLDFEAVRRRFAELSENAV